MEAAKSDGGRKVVDLCGVNKLDPFRVDAGDGGTSAKLSTVRSERESRFLCGDRIVLLLEKP